MHLRAKGLPRVPSDEGGFFLGLKSLGNKRGARLVSAAAVTPAPRVVGMIIGPKASVLPCKFPVKSSVLSVGPREILYG